MCMRCRSFICDFIQTGIPPTIPFSKDVRKRMSPEAIRLVSEWIHRMFEKIPKDSLDKAKETASRIAQRGRPLSEYTLLLQSSTFNFLTFECMWLSKEVQFLQTHLLELNLFKGRHYPTLLHTAWSYIAYMTILLLPALHEIHFEHSYKKPYVADETTTVADKDDYQKDILNEVDLSDLYT